ncbi:MAG: thioredoxin family protein [Phycisphaeraceae bacterium]|nr:thioredoxin family protein [Phycisphaeraceae bacterium]
MPSRAGFTVLLVAVVALSMLAWLMRSGGGPAPKPAAFSSAVTLDVALQRSEQEGRPVLVFATADWCGPCQALKRNALASSKIEQLIKGGTIPVYADVTGPDQVSIDAARRLRVGPIPALIVVWKGEELARHEGNTSASNLEKWLETALSRTRSAG